jgi:hypothetical protein
MHKSYQSSTHVPIGSISLDLEHDAHTSHYTMYKSCGLSTSTGCLLENSKARTVQTQHKMYERTTAGFGVQRYNVEYVSIRRT